MCELPDTNYPGWCKEFVYLQQIDEKKTSSPKKHLNKTAERYGEEV